MEKNGTLASPEIARARRVLPVPGGPMRSTPLGMRPPSFWNFCGSRRNSMISRSSSLASSTPATSLNVTFFCWLLLSFALLLPNDSARLPEPCICRMKKMRNAIMMTIGVQLMMCPSHDELLASRAVTSTPLSSMTLTRFSICGGAKVLIDWPFLNSPMISLPAPGPGDLMTLRHVSALELGHEVAEAQFRARCSGCETRRSRTGRSREPRPSRT